PTAELRHLPLPPLGAARGELRGAMALSFVKFLLERGGEQSFTRLLTEAQPGQVEVTAQQIYGSGLSALEEQWQQFVAAGSARDIKAGQFLRMSMRYLRPHRLRVVEILLLAGLGIAFSTVALPLATKRLVDSALPKAVRTVS